MNLLGFFKGLFTGHQAKELLEGVKASARQDAQLLVGTYTQEFADEAAKLLHEQQQRFLGLFQAPSVQTVETVQAGYVADYKRHELMHLAKERGITFNRGATLVELASLLAVRDLNSGPALLR